MRTRTPALMMLLVAGLTATAAAQGKRADLDGVWILAGNARTESLQLTPAGQAARAKYDYLTNDPGMRCIPASISRVMHTPSPPIEIRQHADRVEVNYEFMDVHRRIPLKAGLTVKDAPIAVKEFPHLGRSIARYEGDTLVVETEGVEAGVHDTLGTPGLPQSAQMRTVERFTASGTKLEIAVTHEDPVFYERPFTVTYTYQRLPGGTILPWDCTPEEAGYQRFIPRPPASP
jgi:hypothetical protein